MLFENPTRKDHVVIQTLAMLTGAEVALLAGAAALLGSLVGGCRKRKQKPRLPEKRIEITVQRIDRPYRKRR